MTVIDKCEHGYSYGTCMWCASKIPEIAQLMNMRGQAAGQQQGTARIAKDETEDETEDEKAARLRQERFERTGVVEAPAYMPEDRYRGEYLGRTWFMSLEVKEQAEECLRVCHCHKCQKIDSRSSRIEATRFFVRFEDDPMQNYPTLAHLTCHRCGFEEYYPLRMDPRKQAQSTDAKYIDTQMRQKIADKKLQEVQQKHELLIRNMVIQAAQRLGIPDNMIQSEAEAMRRILERDLNKNEINGMALNPYKNMISPAPDELYGQQAEQIARSISDPDARRQFVTRMLKEQGKL